MKMDTEEFDRARAIRDFAEHITDLVAGAYGKLGLGLLLIAAAKTIAETDSAKAIGILEYTLKEIGDDVMAGRTK